MWGTRPLVVLATVFTAAVAAAPQTSSIRISVDLAQTDVVVTDRNGHPVRDLEAADFQLFDNGQLQTITNFSWVDVIPSNRAAHSISGLPPAPIPNREDLGRAVVLMVDDAGTNTADLAGILPVLRRFVADQILPGDLTAVTASRGGMGMYEQLTSDKTQLYAAIDRIGRRPASLSCDYIPPFVSQKNAELFHYVPGDFINSANFCPPADKNGALRRAIERLSNLPGRKAVVLFSHLFGASSANVAFANRAGVVVYVLDPVGGEPAKVRVPGPLGVKGSAMLAEETGGFRKLTTPGQIEQDLRQVVDEMSGYYVLGYHVSHSASEFEGHTSPHSIRVRVLHKNLTVHARNTLPVFAPTAAAKKAPETRAEYLAEALFSPFSLGGLRVTVEPGYKPSTSDQKTGHGGIDLNLRITVENGVDGNAASLTFDTAVAIIRPDGTTVLSTQKEVTLAEITPKQAARYRRLGVRFRLRVELTQSGDYQLRVAVRDPASSKSGSTYTYLTIPDFSKGRLALTTPVLTPSDWNEFAAGETVHFSCKIFGSSAARTRAEILLYNETGPVGSRQRLRNETENGTSMLKGDVALPADLAAGEYAFRLITWDGAGASSRVSATYWSRFRILPAAR